MKEDNKYEDKETNQKEWELLSNPEDEIIKKNYDYVRDYPDISLFHLVRTFKDEYKIKISKSKIEEAFQKAGFNVYASQVKNCSRTTKEKEKKKKKDKDLTITCYLLAQQDRGKAQQQKELSMGQMEWIVPTQTPMALIKLGNDETNFAYWNSEKGDKKKTKSQLGVGYFGY